MFKLSQRSIEKLTGVDERLVRIVMRAITTTDVDFGVTCGLRTLEEQGALFKAGASQRMNSPHLTGRAVDLVAYVNGKTVWALNVYDNIAVAMRQAAIDEKVGLRWGAAWIVPDIRNWSETMEDAMNYYIDVRRKQGRRPFVDAPHFELID